MPFPFLAAALVSFAPANLPVGADLEPAPPSMVVGGQLAPTCGWPSTVQLATDFNDPFCTGTLVDARTVVTAAHCLDPAFSGWSADQVIFGESVGAPQASTPIANCVIHPQWEPGTGEPGQSFLFDLGVCTLAADAPDVPIVPPLMGCEADVLTPGQQMTIVGFGIDNEQQGSGAGTKRWTTQIIESVDEATNDLTLLGAGGSSACFGDSGGPVFVELPDGSWRLAGVTSTAHPSVWNQPQMCGYGVVYDMIHTQMTWFEGQTGRDLTPCHDADGTWNPDERCDALPMELTPGGVAWAAQCHGGMVSGPGASCGDPIGDPTGTTGGTGDDTGPGPDTTDGPGPDTTDSGPVDTSTGGVADDTTDGDDLPGGTGSTGLATGGGERPGEPEGCGCRQRSAGGAAPLLLLALGLVRRRRRSTSPRC